MKLFDRFTYKISLYTGSSWAFIAALLMIIIWAVFGPIYKYSDTWQLIANTGTTLITFLLVFIIQHTQNKETKAIQAKLSALIIATENLSNELADLENMDEKEIDNIKEKLVDNGKTSNN